MKPILILFLSILFSQGYTQERSYSVSGRVNVFSRTGDVYVFLATDSTFHQPFSGIDTLVFPVNRNKSSVEYSFENVQPGRYALSCFQDRNGNGTFDHFLIFPLEPWAFTYFTEVRYPPKFEEISFMVADDYRIDMKMGR